MNILYLTNNPISSPLSTWLTVETGEQLTIFSDRLSEEYFNQGEYGLVISYNYKYIIPLNILDLLPGRFINLHISLLPWNKGASPNLWSFLEDTPKGVSIHLIDKGIDTGDLLYQEEVVFNEEVETLASTYNHLHSTIQTLFKSHWLEIKSGTYKALPQLSGGSLHFIRDLATLKPIIDKAGWDVPIKVLKELVLE